MTLAAFCFVMVLAWSPCLHDLFHGDGANSTSHDCAVTLLAQGGLAVTSPAVALSLPTPPTLSALRLIASPPAIGDVRLSPGRAPPLRAG